MCWRPMILALAVTAACGGKQSVEGTCEYVPLLPGVPGSPAGISAGWVCTTAMADASRRVLRPCDSGIEEGGSCPPSIETGPPNECFECGSSAIGTHWICASAGWKASGTFSCSQ